MATLLEQVDNSMGSEHLDQASEASSEMTEVDSITDSGPNSPVITHKRQRAEPSTDHAHIAQTAPRKRRNNKKISTEEAEPEPPVILAKKIMYIFSVLSASELKKSATKRDPKILSMRLDSDKPWDTMKAQILARVAESLAPKTLDFSRLSVTFFIPRVVPRPGMALACEDDYGFMTDRVQKMKADDPTVNILVSEVVGDEEDQEPENKEPKAKGKKIQKDPALLPGNVKKNDNILLLQEEWKCLKRTPTCVGVYCYVAADTGIHLPLNHERFDCWASAMLKGDDSATLQKPPNHKLFDSTNMQAISPVLQRRLENQNTKASSAPIFNFTIGNEVMGLFRPPTLASTAPHPAPAAAMTHTLPDNSLLHSSRTPGEDMSLEAFCTVYNLRRSILEKLTDNFYSEARVLRFVTIDELKEMDFKLGEIASLRDAVEIWSIPKAN